MTLEPTKSEHPAPLVSGLIQHKLYEQGGQVLIHQFRGKPCRITANPDGRSFTSDKLNHYKVSYEYWVFDVIYRFLLSCPDHRARKGNGHGKADKVGFGNCTEDTVLGNVAIHYMKKELGESCYDPIFVFAAILDWAGIAYNQRGYIQLKSDFI